MIERIFEVALYVYSMQGPNQSDYRVRPYIEGIHWIKGKVIGTGAFCTCHRARDTENGTMFAVKQVRSLYIVFKRET